MPSADILARPLLVGRRALRHVMGGAGEVVVTADPGAGARERTEWLVSVAESRLADLEERWTRFSTTSDVARVGAAAGRWVEVAPETHELLALALDAWDVTNGRVDPTVGGALAASGYDRTFAEVVDAAGPSRTGAATQPTPGARAVELHPDGHLVRVATGTRLDLGGLGKGRAADLVADELLDLGAAGACVNLGGDVAVCGRGPHHGAWQVAIADALAPDDDDRDVGTLRLTHGGVATSTTLGRRWTTHDGTSVHHLVDPTTGRPAETGVVAVTVVASTAVWAEVVAKAALIAGPVDGSALVAGAGLAAVLTTDDGTRHVVGDLDPFLEGALR